MASNLPDYVASAQPVPQDQRAPWYKNTAQTYAGIMLWFVFWANLPPGEGSPGGALAQGLGAALVGLVLAAFLCHFLYYLVPGLLGMKTGLPLYIVGTSTYGVKGGFVMPGFLMGLLQFGWLGVNAFFTGMLLVAPFGAEPGSVPHWVVAAVFAIAAAFMGLKGIQYVARVATYLPLIPLVILIVLCVMTMGGLGSFDPKTLVGDAEGALSSFGVVSLLLVYVIGFFATAGAAGCDFGMNNRDGNDVQMGGLAGVAGATILAGGLALLVVAGAFGAGIGKGELDPTKLMGEIMGNENVGNVFMYLLAIAAFPPACFSAFIAANSFKTTLPKVNPFISVGIGTLVSIGLVVTGWAGQAVDVFKLIGASFGPVCGAMAADYLLAGKKWAGPRAGLNPAGWISWVAGFCVGGMDLAAKMIPGLSNLQGVIPVPPLTALIVGFVLYLVLAKAGLESATLEMPSGSSSDQA
jgi:cytosine permease